jgi:competence protein ComEC
MVYKNIRNILVLIAISVWFAAFSVDNKLHIVACNVGQGDAILIQKNPIQILIDGGPNKSVLDCLGKHIPFWDRKIELVISTHADKDHSGGLVDVFRAYKIQKFLTNDLENPLFSTQNIEVLRNEVGGSGTKIIYPSKGMVIKAGLIYLDILHPDTTFVGKNTNDYSIINTLRYKGFKAVFMGDLELNISERLFEEEKIENIDYIKISHHGSKNGTSEKLLDLLRPKNAIISVGKNNYGHPAAEVIKMLEDRNIKIKRTDKEGDIDIKVE